MSKNEIIMMDAPEAAKQVTVTLWQSMGGRLFNEERLARYDSATHRKCEECGAIVEKAWLSCPSCRDKRDYERWLAMPRVEYDGKAMLYSQANDKYYSDEDEAVCDLEKGENLNDLQLVICEPNYARQLDADDFDLPEDGDLSQTIIAAMDEYNAKVKKEIVSWSPGKTVPVFKEG